MFALCVGEREMKEGEKARVRVCCSFPHFHSRTHSHTYHRIASYTRIFYTPINTPLSLSLTHTHTHTHSTFGHMKER